MKLVGHICISLAGTLNDKLFSGVINRIHFSIIPSFGCSKSIRTSQLL